MVNKISEYSYSLRIFIASAIFVLLRKYNFIFPKQLDSNGTDQNPLIAAFFVKSFGSNHPRRTNISILMIQNLKNKLFEKFKIFYGFGNNQNNSILEPTHLWKEDLLNHKIKLNQILFVGDSHVEFYSRLYKINFKNHNLEIKGLWIGPMTMAGFSTSFVAHKWLSVTLKQIQKNNYSCKKTAIIFSLGHIDIRTSVGFLICTKVVTNPVEAIEKLSNIFENLLQSNLMKKIRMNYSNVSWMAIPPPSPDVGIKIDSCSKKQAMNLIRNDNFTIFGSSSERAVWTSLLNQKLKIIADRYDFDFLYESSLCDLNGKTYIPLVMKSSDSFDGTHLSKSNIILNIIKSFLFGT